MKKYMTALYLGVAAIAASLSTLLKDRKNAPRSPLFYISAKLYSKGELVNITSLSPLQFRNFGLAYFLKNGIMFAKQRRTGKYSA